MHGQTDRQPPNAPGRASSAPEAPGRDAPGKMLSAPEAPGSPNKFERSSSPALNN